MAEQAGATKTPRRRSRKLKYFYLNGNLHKSLHINRSADSIVTWCYPLAKRVTYTYSDVRKYKEPAFTTQEVCAMIGRHRNRVEEAIISGNVARPQSTYGIDENMRAYQYMWSEKDIMELHAHFLTVHRGRPRKDGRVTPQKMPNARELRAMIRQEQILYVLDEDGDFKPVWKAQNFD